MKYFRYFSAFLIFLVACPLSWVAAWNAGTWFTFGLSVLVPTYGMIYWGLLHLIGNSFLHSLISWVLGFIGAFVSTSAISVLVKGYKLGHGEGNRHDTSTTANPQLKNNLQDGYRMFDVSRLELLEQLTGINGCMLIDANGEAKSWLASLIEELESRDAPLGDMSEEVLSLLKETLSFYRADDYRKARGCMSAVTSKVWDSMNLKG